jgi:low affinity Fe/Cu permease
MAESRSNGRRRGEPHMPSDVTANLSLFDRFATAASRFVSRAWFFALCLLLVVLWAPSYFLLRDLNTWQLIINTVTTIVTFLLVALLQNTQTRADEATQHKLNAIADGLADLMAAIGEDKQALRKDRLELRKAVGLEDRESS